MAKARRNPGLVIYNPVRTHGQAEVGRAIELRYEYRGKFYTHKFEDDQTFISGRVVNGVRQLILWHRHSKPLWASQQEVDTGEIRE